MNSKSGDQAFAGSIPELYQRYLVPLIFQPYAADLARRVARRNPQHVLEVAAGTGVVTREITRVLPPEVRITATDLNQPMLDQAIATGTSRPVKWEQADALQLPFPDESFDVVACQFAAMFFSDKAKAFAEARRVLRPGGFYIFSVWDCLEENEFADMVIRALAKLLPEKPPDFLSKLPHGYHEPAVILRDLAAGGFEQPADYTTVRRQSKAESARTVAIAYCQGTPLRNKIESADPDTKSGKRHALAARLSWQGCLRLRLPRHPRRRDPAVCDFPPR